MVSLSEARSGVLAKAERIAALNECPEIFFALLPMWRSSNDITIVVKIFGVRFLPFANRKTSQLLATTLFLWAARDFRAE
jgi:hypothetical protein